MRLFLAIICAKIVKSSLKIFGKIFKFNGSYFPGKIALKLCPDFLLKINKPKKIIAVTGTNGKTTTCNLITDSLEKNGYKVLDNRLGSNVDAGIVTAFLNGVTITNKPKHEIAVIEVDERSSLKIYPKLKPTYIVITNLFRDSIKRNAHSEFIFNIINKELPQESTLICNADDLISNRLGNGNKKIYFGIDKQENDRTESINIINDARICPICHRKLKYEFIRYNHIGRATCENCGYKSPEPDYRVTKIDYNDNWVLVKIKENEYKFNLISNSIFNIYNEIATIGILAEIGVPIEKIQKTIDELEITKLRYDKEEINGYTLINNLAKGQNPVACSIVFDYVRREKGQKEVILLIEDYHDNRESSENITWLYECDFEFLNDQSIEKIIIGGIRAQDIYFRLLLAGVPQERLVYVNDETKIPDYLSLKKENTIYILYEMYNREIVNNVNTLIKTKFRSHMSDNVVVM